jgi:hypothetical protein
MLIAYIIKKKKKMMMMMMKKKNMLRLHASRVCKTIGVNKASNVQSWCSDSEMQGKLNKDSEH